jgi:threonyl-tRNA synthetase
MEQKDKLLAIRHSAEHVLTMAMLRLWPGKIKPAMGPATEDGFYFDFDSEIKISENDFDKIEKEMSEIIEADLPIIKDEMEIEEARKFFDSNIYKDNEYKQEWIDDIEARGEKVSVYWVGEKGKQMPESFVDICSGPHVKSTGAIKAFKLLKIAGAYWHGDEKNKMLQRIYGVAFDSQEKLDRYLTNLQEAKKRDHRILGRELDLFHIDPMVGMGLPMWYPKGALLWRLIEDFWYKQHLQNGYQLVRTPHIGSKRLWETSGHWNFYNDSMYPPLEVSSNLEEFQKGEEKKIKDSYLVKPMNCPFHIVLYNSRMRSYRDLPFRWAECGTVYRYEKSGELSGLTRVRGFTQDDAHIICPKEQVMDELTRVIRFIKFMFSTFGFQNYKVYLALRDPNNTAKYSGNEEGWNFTQDVLKEAAKSEDLDYTSEEGEAVFYGPKLDFKIKDCLDREWQCATLQFDFNLPERFDMTFINNQGQEERPYVLHRALFGSFERFIGLLIEHYAGAFPVWFSPVQSVVIPVGEKHHQYAKEINDKLLSNSIRTELYDGAETVAKKISRAIKQKVPYAIILGDKEISQDNISVRLRHNAKTIVIDIDEFINRVNKEVKERKDIK